MTYHLETMQQWWEGAEMADASPGDTIIERHVCDKDGDIYFTIGEHREGMRGLIGTSSTRILERAPKPTWHDALAVIATYGHIEGFITRGPLLNVGKGAWRAVDGCLSQVGQLHDVTPLIPAEVTDEMVVRFLEEDNGRTDIRVLLAAALGAEEV